ncbi:hypothetical protein PNOK_0328200 [Pyrrhoderma noxium]|uniref:Golgi apparatus membrane protein TVP38 n=1 Tax=Pyrrhoderma noxium TaxID=2282107 RepID=A0A286UMH9_9AGAM|nr:hypothetical protein PNOK_0328200 [Pyrrhoderma noxium]
MDPIKQTGSFSTSRSTVNMPSPQIVQPIPGRGQAKHKAYDSESTPFFVEQMRITRTPSPTPSEVEALENKKFDWSRLRTKEFWFRRETLIRGAIFAVVIAIVVLMIIYKHDIIDALEPPAAKLRDMPAGWLIPVALIVVVSFPPLFGHEIIAILVGVVWGLWIGFGIVAFGTLLGDIIIFFFFRALCMARCEKYEKTNISYGCLARSLREGGFKLAIIARFSAYPSHLLTAVFSTGGIDFKTYIISCVIALPKQLFLVYTGHVFEASGSGEQTKKDKVIYDVALVAMILLTLVAGRMIKTKMDQVRPEVVYARRKHRQQMQDEENVVQIRDMHV